MNKKYSYIGQYRPDDNRDIHDRSYRRSTQDFIIRLEDDEVTARVVSTSPQMPEETIKVIRQAIQESYRQGLPWRGTINDLQVQIYEKIKQ